MQGFGDRMINAYLDVMILKFRGEKAWRKFTKSEKNLYVWDRVSSYRQMWADAAWTIDAEFSEIGEGIWEIGHGNKRTRINIYLVQLDDPVTLELAGNKPFCYSILQRNGLPVPLYRVFRRYDLREMKIFIEEHGGYFVIKPAVGTSAGMGVTTHIRTYRECLDATARALMYGDEVIIERLVPGECYRILVLDGKVLHASRRRGLRITGDGNSTVAELMESENAKRAKTSRKGIRAAVEYTPDVMATLEAQGLRKASILKDGQVVLVKSNDTESKDNVEVRTVYSENATHLLCEDIRDKAILAAKTLGSMLAGVDVITLDPSRDLGAGGGVINEVNTTPGLHHHYNLDEPDTKSVAADILSYLLEISN